jgi:hypothetical protein
MQLNVVDKLIACLSKQQTPPPTPPSLVQDVEMDYPPPTLLSILVTTTVEPNDGQEEEDESMQAETCATAEVGEEIERGMKTRVYPHPTGLVGRRTRPRRRKPERGGLRCGWD